MAKKDKPTQGGENTGIDQARRALLANINKKFKTDVAREFTLTQNIPRISTSYFLLDDVLGGGIPEGRLVEFYGWESSGKSFLTTKIMASAQQQGKAVFLFDVENAFNREFAEKCGLNVDGTRFGFSDEQNAAIIFETIRDICIANAQCVEDGEKPLYDVIVVDSVAALMTEHEEENTATHAKIGDLAMTLSRGIKKLPRIASKGKTTIIFINQIREKIGVLYGDPETTPGGNALKFFCSLRIKLRRLGGAEGTYYGSNKDDKIGHRVVATVVKNKTAPPHRKAEFAIFYDGSTDDSADIFEMFEKYNLWTTFQGNIRTYEPSSSDEIRCNGKPKMIEAIKQGGVKLREEMISKIREAMSSKGATNLTPDEVISLNEEDAKRGQPLPDWTSEEDDDDSFSIESDLSDF